MVSKTSPSRSSEGETQAVGYIVVTFRVSHDQETGQYVSACEELIVSSCGDTVDEAFKNIADATTQYLDAIDENGSREEVFRRRNIPIYPVKPGGERIIHARNRDFVSSIIYPIAGGVGDSGKAPALL